jgi:transaldolase
VKATGMLHDMGQSLWLDTITRDLLTSGTLRHYRDHLSVTGLTSNPSISDAAIAATDAYDEQIDWLAGRGLSGDALLFAPVHERTAGVDGWVSLEVSPLLAHETSHTTIEAIELHRQAHLPDLFIKIPGRVRAWVPSRRPSFTACPST